jgi:zinc protease
MNALTRAVSGIAALVAAAPAHAGVFPYPVHTASLDNGLEVYVVPMPTPGVVAWHTWMAVGSGDEVVEGRTGFAHFFEHLMFYGSDALPREVR